MMDWKCVRLDRSNIKCLLKHLNESVAHLFRVNLTCALSTFQWSPLVLNPSYTILHLLGANKVQWLYWVLHASAWCLVFTSVLSRFSEMVCFYLLYLFIWMIFVFILLKNGTFHRMLLSLCFGATCRPRKTLHTSKPWIVLISGFYYK